MTGKQVIAAIRANHLKSNISAHEDDPATWGHPDWDKAWLDGNPACAYIHVPIVGGEYDGTVQRVYPPARLQRKIEKAWDGKR